MQKYFPIINLESVSTIGRYMYVSLYGFMSLIILHVVRFSSTDRPYPKYYIVHRPQSSISCTARCYGPIRHDLFIIYFFKFLVLAQEQSERPKGMWAWLSACHWSFMFSPRIKLVPHHSCPLSCKRTKPGASPHIEFRVASLFYKELTGVYVRVNGSNIATQGCLGRDQFSVRTVDYVQWTMKSRAK